VTYVLKIKNKQAKILSKKQSSKSLLAEINAAFKSSGIAELQLQNVIIANRKRNVNVC
jgi:hypothetical protein